MICWYCHWGWPKPISDIYRRYVAIAGESAMDYGPAHVVWADENWDCAQSCLDGFDDDVARWNGGRHSAGELEAVRASLRELVALPVEILNAEPEDYDGEHPERFPPPRDMEMVRGN